LLKKKYKLSIRWQESWSCWLFRGLRNWRMLIC